MMINVALLSRWHVHADDYARDIQANEDMSIGLVWDEESQRGKQWAKELGVPFESDLLTVFKNPAIDAVIVNTPTSMHKEIIVAAAEHGKHIFTEKVLAFTKGDSEDIYRVVEKAGVKLMVSLPMLTKHNYLYAQKSIDEGWIGELTMVRCRVAHNGGVAAKGEKYGWLPERFYNKEQAGGGSMMDLGAHPIYVTNRLAGKAKSVSANLVEEPQHDVDSNAALLVQYETGALGIIETSFRSYGSPFQLEVYGTEGTLFIHDDKITLTSAHVNEGKTTELTKKIKEMPMPLLQWVEWINNGLAPTITKEDVVRLSFMNEVAAKSSREGRRIDLDDMIG